MNTVTSTDGTTIAYERIGDGPALILVGGALCARDATRPLAEQLASQFTVYSYDRRGRGDSGDTAPYAVAREVEDVEAMIGAAGGSAHLYGISSGATLALEAANSLEGVEKLALYEMPFVVDDTRTPVPADYASHLSELIASDRRADALRYFMTAGVQVPRIFVSMMRFMPAWKRLKAIAHTLDYDTAILGPEFGSGKPLPTDRWTSVTAPAVVIDGGKSPEWMRNTQKALADLLGAEYRTLEGQTHMVKPKALAPVLAEFLAGSVQRSVAA